MMRSKQIDRRMVLLSNKYGWLKRYQFLVLITLGLMTSGFSAQKSFAQSAVITFASKSRSKVITPDFNKNTQPYFSVIGEVNKPGCYAWDLDAPAPTASEVISRSGGETDLSKGSVRIVRRGRSGLRLMSTALTNYSLLPGDILIVEKKSQYQSRVIHFDKNQSLNSTSQAAQNQSNERVSISIVNLADHPAVIEVDSKNATLGNVLSNRLGISQINLSDIKVISPTASRNSKASSATTKLESGTVLIFKKNSLANENNTAKLPAPISQEEKKTVLVTPNADPIPTPRVKNLTTQLSKPVDSNRAETLIPFGQLNDTKKSPSKPDNQPKDFPILAIPDLNLSHQNSNPKPLKKIELKPASTPTIQSTPSPIRLLPKPPELNDPKAGDLQASVKIQKFDRSLESVKPLVESNKAKVVQTAMLESNNSSASPFPDFIENVKREPLPPIEGDELTFAVPTPVDLGDNNALASEDASLSDLSLVGIISGVGILVAVISVLISALWNQLDENSGMQEMVAENEAVQRHHREKVITTSRETQETLRSESSTLQSLIDNNIPFIEEPVESPSKVEFFGNASKSRTYRVDPVHPRTSDKAAERKFAAEIPVPHHIKSKHMKKKGMTGSVASGAVVQPPEDQPNHPQNLPEQDNIQDLENLANQQTNERLDQGESNQKTQAPAGLIERALMAMKKEMENKKS